MKTSLDALLAHRAWVRSLAAALAQPADADDLEQEAWLAALARPPKGDAPRAWLATVLRRTASNLRRALSRRAARERAAARPEAAEAEDLVARAETHERVVRAVLALPEPYRSTVLLRFFEGLAPSDIARRTGAPVDTVKARLRRALARLRDELRDGRAQCLLLLAVPRRPLGALAMTLKAKIAAAVAAASLLAGGSVAVRRAFETRAPARADAVPGLPAAAAPAARDLPAMAPEAPSLPAAERRDFLVKGVVTGTQEFVPYALAEVDGERRLLEPMELTRRPGGVYSVRVPYLAHDVEFGVLGHGFVRQARRLLVAPGGEYAADFAVEPGLRIAGTVEDGQGRPVAGLRVLAVAHAQPPWGIASSALLDMERLLAESLHFAEGRTDDAGRLEIAGLPPGTYALFSRSERWILEHGPLGAPEERARVTAVPAHAITGTIRDARTGVLVPKASVEIDVGSPRGYSTTKAAGVRRGQLWVTWKPQPAEEEGFDARVRVTAAGYHAAERVLACPRGTRRVDADIALDPVDAEDLAALRIEVTDARGRLVREDLSCALSGADDPGRRPTAKEFRPLGPGVFEIRAPAGRWSVRLAPRHGLGDVSWSGVLELGRDERARCTMPPFGIVRLRHAGAGPWYASAERGDGSRSYHWEIEDAEARVVAAPGEWKVGIEGNDLRTIVVLDGAETVVDLD